MRATRELIDGLRQAADLIETKRFDYHWNSVKSCNCGVLAWCVIEGNVEQAFHVYGSTWTEMSKFSKQVCSQTGIPLNTVFAELYKIGLTEPEDFEQIEFLGLMTNDEYYELDEDTRRDIHLTTFGKRENVILFFRELADTLETQLLNQVSSKTEQIIPVSVREE